MRMYLISDNMETRIGMRLAGIEGELASDAREVLDAIERCLKDKSIGILLISEKLAKLVPDRISEVKLDHDLPLVTEIPDRLGSIRGRDSITKYVKESIGIKI